MRFAILHVDDSPEERILVAEAFCELGHACDLSGAHDGYHALQMLTLWKSMIPPDVPRLILLDVNMPRMGGLELLALLKGDQDLRSIPVVMLTNSGRSQERMVAERLGSRGYEVKPTHFDGYVALAHRLEALADVGSPLHEHL